MSTQFPLYSTLSTNLPKKDLTVAQKTELITEIKKMSADAHELIYVIIKMYYIENEEKNTGLPYSCIINKDNLDFDVTNLPIPLRHMLYKFMSIHTKKVKEDNEIASTLKKI